MIKRMNDKLKAGVSLYSLGYVDAYLRKAVPMNNYGGFFHSMLKEMDRILIARKNGVLN